jgi:NAD(P)H-hydrate repair Nnr-like enzyme with NAD(P)H-hydrate epimerase domain
MHYVRPCIAVYGEQASAFVIDYKANRRHQRIRDCLVTGAGDNGADGLVPFAGIEFAAHDIRTCR